MKKIFILISCFLSLFAVTPVLAQQMSFYNFRPTRDSIQLNRSVQKVNVAGDDDFYLLWSPIKSLQDELKLLAPESTNAELMATGNYSLNFLVNGKMVYTENLHPGAILLEDKLTTRPIDIAFISKNRSNLWSINLWDRFMAKVGFQLFDSKEKELTVQLKVYVKGDQIKFSNVVGQSKLLVVSIPKPIDLAKMKPHPIDAGSGFKLSKDKLKAHFIINLNTRIEQKSYRMINGIVLLKKGKLMLEQYYNGENRETLHDARSVTKSITSTLMGMAIADGLIKSTDQYLSEFYDLKKYANYSLKKDNVKLIDLLTMSSAFDGNDEVESSPGNEENMYPTADYTKFALDLPMADDRRSGEKWTYFTTGTYLLMDILDRKIPGGVEGYAKQKLFDPLKIKTLEWARTPQGRPFGGGGLRLRALDFAKYGQLYANGGSYEGAQLLEKSWVDKSLSPLQHLPSDREGYYGMLFWNKVFLVNGKKYEAYYSSGNGGNKIYIFKNSPIVIVITASAYNKSFAHLQADEIVAQYLLPASL